MNHSEFGRLLQALREERDNPKTGYPLTQKDLDDICKFPNGRVGRIERGEINVFDEETLVKLADALELICLCLLYTSPSPRDGLLSRMPSSA